MLVIGSPCGDQANCATLPVDTAQTAQINHRIAPRDVQIA
jgi:hypothetical protein